MAIFLRNKTLDKYYIERMIVHINIQLNQKIFTYSSILLEELKSVEDELAPLFRRKFVFQVSKLKEN